MTDHSAPGVYTQPGGDADDVLGHRAAFDAQPDFRALDKAAAHDADTDDDAEGHRFVAADRAQAADGRVVFAHDDDVQGHMKVRDRAAAQDDEDDVEGHMKVRGRAAAQDGDAAPDFRAL